MKELELTPDGKESVQMVFDFDKVKSLEDIIAIIKAMDLHLIVPDDGGNFKEVLHLLKKIDENS